MLDTPFGKYFGKYSYIFGKLLKIQVLAKSGASAKRAVLVKTWQARAFWQVLTLMRVTKRRDCLPSWLIFL